MTTTDLRDVRALAETDRRAARTLAAAEADARRAQQDRESADAAADRARAAADADVERELRRAQGRQSLASQRRLDQTAARAEIAAQRRAQRAARRVEARARAAERRAWVAARIDYVRHNAPAVYSTGIYGMAVAGAVYGQVTAATGRGWPVIVGVAIASAIEGLALSMALTAHQLRLAGERAVAPRVLTWACALVAGGINYLGHVAQDPVGAVLLALLSVAGITVWEIRSGAKHRAALRALGLIPTPPARFGWRRWVRYPLDTLAAWSVDVRERVSDEAAELIAWRAAERHRRRVADEARRAARQCAGKGDAAGAVEALQRMAQASPAARTSVRPGVGAPERPSGRTDAGTPGRPDAPADGRAPGRAYGPADGPAPARTDGRTYGGTEARTEARTYARTRVRESDGTEPDSPLVSAGAGRRAATAPTGTAGRTRRTVRGAVVPDRPDPDVSDLLDAGRAVRDELAAVGRAVTRDELVTRLRSTGLTVSSGRASVLLAALNRESAVTADEVA